MKAISGLHLMATSIVGTLLCCPATAGLNITANGQAYLDDPDREIVVVIATARGKEQNVIQALHIVRSETMPEFGTIFAKVKAQQVLEWPENSEVDFVDILDDSQAAVVYHLLAQLHRIELLDDVGAYRPSVLNISIGPPRNLIGKDGSGERAVQRAILDVIERHGIPVVISAGNDGPQSGLVNRWAPPGALIATATDSTGTVLWERSSRYAAPMPSNVTMFAANGVDTVGARAGCRPKSQEQQDADERAHLVDIVGQANAPSFEVASGTSFAAGNLTKSVCLLHQALGLLALKSAALTPINQDVSVPPFVRTYIDSGFDRSHPVFSNRLADARLHYGPMTITLSQSTKEDARRVLLGNGVDVDIHYRPVAVAALLRRAAAPRGELTREQVGDGFISAKLVANFLAELHYDGLVAALAESDPRRATWIDRIKSSGNPPVFSSTEVDQIGSYCESYDLVLGIPLFSQP